MFKVTAHSLFYTGVAIVYGSMLITLSLGFAYGEAFRESFFGLDRGPLHLLKVIVALIYVISFFIGLLMVFYTLSPRRRLFWVYLTPALILLASHGLYQESIATAATRLLFAIPIGYGILLLVGASHALTSRRELGTHA